MKNYETIEVDNYPQFIAKVNSIFDVSCLDSIPKNANKYTLRMFEKREDLIHSLAEYSEGLNSYIAISGGVKDQSKDLVILYLPNIYTDLSEVILGGHYA